MPPTHRPRGATARGHHRQDEPQVPSGTPVGHAAGRHGLQHPPGAFVKSRTRPRRPDQADAAQLRGPHASAERLPGLSGTVWRGRHQRLRRRGRLHGVPGGGPCHRRARQRVWYAAAPVECRRHALSERHWCGAPRISGRAHQGAAEVPARRGSRTHRRRLPDGRSTRSDRPRAGTRPGPDLWL